MFRIDHFLGKEAMRSLLISRFANAILEPLWRRTYVSAVKITMAESFGVEDRGSFYDSVGALRDVMQNHLLQMVALFAMEQPVNESANALRDEKTKVLMAARPVDPHNFVRGQYHGYRSVPGVAPDSDTETFGAFRVDFDSPRWSVPFFLRAGKAMAETVTEMTIEFTPAPPALAARRRPPASEPHPDRGEARQLHRADLAEEGAGRRDGPRADHPRPRDRRARRRRPEPYELLLEDAMEGDPTLFARQDSIEESWRIVEPILTNYPKAIQYERGTWGPAAARKLVDGFGAWPGEPVRVAAEPSRTGSEAESQGHCRLAAHPSRMSRGIPHAWRRGW